MMMVKGLVSGLLLGSLFTAGQSASMSLDPAAPRQAAVTAAAGPPPVVDIPLNDRWTCVPEPSIAAIACVSHPDGLVRGLIVCPDGLLKPFRGHFKRGRTACLILHLCGSVVRTTQCS